MGRHRAQAQFERARWNLTYLAPIWGLQMVLALACVGIFSARLGSTARHFNNQAGKPPVVELVWEVVNIALSLVAGACTAFEVAKYVSESLTPWSMLFTQVLKLACAASILVLDVIVYVQRHGSQRYSLAGLATDVVLVMTAAATAVYAVRAYRRCAAHDDYSHPANVKGYGFNDGVSCYSDGSVGSRHMRTSHDSSKAPRLSLGSVINEPLSMQQGRYSHQRDTKFEEYRTRHTSLAGSENDRNMSETAPMMETAKPARTRGKSVSGLRSVPEEEGDGTDATPRSTDAESLDSEESVKVPLVSQRGPRWRERADS